MRKYIVNLAMKLQGISYIWGGNNPSVGFDCSGFVIWILQVFDKLPSGDWTAEDLRKYFNNYTTIKKVGDLVFYGKHKHATHVMMYIGNDMCIGASGGDSSCTNAEIAAKLGARVKIKKIDYRTDLMEFGDIDYPKT